jgi:hypothetical protein
MDGRYGLAILVCRNKRSSGCVQSETDQILFVCLFVPSLSRLMIAFHAEPTEQQKKKRTKSKAVAIVSA